MKRYLQFTVVFALVASIFLSSVVVSAAGASYVFDTTYTESNPLKTGEYTLQLNQSKDFTLFVFKPDEIGIYELAVDTNSIIGWWGAYPSGYIRDPGSTSNVMQREIKRIGDVAVIGISSSTQSVSLSIEKVGESQGIIEIEYTDYVNEHTPTQGDYPDDYTLEEIDISKPHTAVLNPDGTYRLDSENGPMLYADLYSSDFSLANAFGSYGALSMRGLCDGVYYNFKAAMKEYNEVLSGTSGVYPLTIDLIRFIQSYGTSQMWFEPQYSPFDSIQKGTADPSSSWMVICLYAPVYSGPTEDVDVTDTDASTPYIIDFVTESQTAGIPITYKLGNNFDNSEITISGSGIFTVQYAGVTHTSSYGKIVIENLGKNAQVKIDGNGIFTISVDLHAVCGKTNVSTVLPTHTEVGRKEYWFCSICNTKYDSDRIDADVLDDADTVIPPTGHTDAVKIDAAEASCNKEGYTAHYFCNVCDAKFDGISANASILSDEDVIIPPTGHTDTTYVPEQTATCTEKGYREYYFCNICEHKYDSADADAKMLSDEELVIEKDHDWGEKYKDENGQTVRDCKDCDAQETIPADPGNDSGSEDLPVEDNSFLSVISNFIVSIFQAIVDFFVSLFIG